MKRLLVLTIGPSCFAGAPGRDAADDGIKPSTSIWNVIGSLEATYTDNALLAPSAWQSNVYWNPDITIRADGSLTEDLY